ncbi:hypothetical protein SNE40_015115 [Patella caerulea]|uniref:Threonine synthase n=1 Tax=Patella caerulea TaxID=87958 RepID=A0AAN8JH46_PATCE
MSSRQMAVIQRLHRYLVCINHYGSYKRAFCTSRSTNSRFDYTERSNIYLLGSPGCGKTTVGKLLGEKLERPVIDVDDDILEPAWRMPVSQKLTEIGGKNFIDEEGKALCQFQSSGSVVCLSGSNPLHAQSMKHIKENGLLIFLDVPETDILSRLEKMKVNRIVGQEAGISMPEILKYRRSFYAKHHDARVMCESGETPKNILNRVLTCLDRLENDKGYISTRQIGPAKRQQFLQTVLQGLAPDGGLLVKADELPVISNCKQKRLVDLDYRERALRLLQEWISPLEIAGGELKVYVDNAYNENIFQNKDVAPVQAFQKNQYMMELFHGPTASFKDFALQLMPQFFNRAIQEEGENNRYLVLVATSGDTGGAVLDGFRQYAGSDTGVLVFYPLNGISELQKHQMTSMAGNNISVVGVDSDFDFCQSTVKHIFRDDHFSAELLNNYNVKLSAANSLNWGRLLPQIVYHASGYLDLVKSGVISHGQEIDICVPTGNFGNILAAYYVKMMGFPIRKLICASNSNDVLTEFFQTGLYDLRKRQLLRTASPAIDILKSSNLERLLHHVSDNDGSLVSNMYHNLDQDGMFKISQHHLANLQTIFTAGSCTEQECKSTLIDTYKRTGYLLDPHTAVCKTVADKLGDSSVPLLLAGTAHNAKFADTVSSWIDPSSGSLASSPNELLIRLNKLSSQPPPHETMLRMSKQKVIHKKKCNASPNELMSIVKEFASNM